MTYILGISAYYHDSAAALVKDGKILSAVQEERFTRIKHDNDFPFKSIEFLLNNHDITLKDVDYVTFYDKPLLTFERLIETYIATIPKGFPSFKAAIPTWIKEKLLLKNLITKNLKKFYNKFSEDKIKFSEHHLSHSASAYFPSSFDEALILTIDGVGEWATTSVSLGKKNNIDIKKEIHFPHSLGLLYSAFTYYLGFKVNSGEYKVMGLAPYGVPKYKDLILNKLIDLKDDGSFRLSQFYFNYSTGLTMTNKKFSSLFGEKVRSQNDKLTDFHMNIAASIQSALEEIIIKLLQNLQKEYKQKNLCLAGGVALNCVANGKILKTNLFENIWVQPASGDAGGSIGSALAFWYLELKNQRNIQIEDKTKDSMNGSFLGPQFSLEYIEKELQRLGANYKKYSSKDEIIIKAAKLLSENKYIGWFQGKMEFGPRALGNRSILADPRGADTQKNLNLKIKFRESFRPFAPAILFEDLEDWFELKNASPYMLMVDKILSKHRKNENNQNNLFGIEKLNQVRSSVPSITHVDLSSRIQTVHKQTNPLFHELLTEFKKITTCPILVNTSFNIRGEPIVCSPKDAYRCFMGTNLDFLIIDNFILDKKEQTNKIDSSYIEKFDLD